MALMGISWDAESEYVVCFELALTVREISPILLQEFDNMYIILF